MITGNDLVEWQLRVADGEELASLLADQPLSINGHAFEARVYAENPDKGFLPATGRIVHLAQPAAVEFRRNHDDNGFHDPAPVRIDAGVRAGDTITPYYDPMIAKLIAWGEDRTHALARMQAALADLHIVGVANNVDFLSRLVANEAFARGDVHTGLIEQERVRLFPEAGADEPKSQATHAMLAFACARILDDETRSLAADPWSSAHGWRLNTTYKRTITLNSATAAHKVVIDYAREGYCFTTTTQHGAGVQVPQVPLCRSVRPSTPHADVVRARRRSCTSFTTDAIGARIGGRHCAIGGAEVGHRPAHCADAEN